MLYVIMSNTSKNVLYKYELPPGSFCIGMEYEDIMARNWKVKGMKLVSTSTYEHGNSVKPTGVRHHTEVYLDLCEW